MNFSQRRALWGLVRRLEQQADRAAKKSRKQYLTAGFSGVDENGLEGTGDEGWRRTMELDGECAGIRHAAHALRNVLRKYRVVDVK